MHYLAPESQSEPSVKTTATPNRLRLVLTLAAVVAVALGLYFRFTRLGDKQFWFDEVHSAACVSGRPVQEINSLFDGKPRQLSDLKSYMRLHAGESYTTTIDALRRGNPENTPLYFMLLRFWAEAFGDSPAMLRAFSALIAVFGGGVLIWLCRELQFGRIAMVCAICWWSLSPFMVLYSQEARTYSLMAVTVVAANLMLMRALRLQSRSSWLSYAFAATIGLYTHMFIAPLLLAHAVCVGVIGFRHSSTEERRRLFTRFTIAGALSVAAFAPWLATLVQFNRGPELSKFLSGRVNVFYLLQSWIEGLATPFVDFGLQGNHFARACNIFVSLAMLGGLAWSMRYVWLHAPRPTALLLFTTSCLPPLMFITYDVVIGGTKSEVVRYWLPAMISLGLTFSYAIGMKCAEGSRRALIVGLMVFVAAAGSCFRSNAAPTWWNKGGFVSRLDLSLNEHEKMKAGLEEIAATPNSLLIVENQTWISFQLLVMCAITDVQLEWAGISDPETFQPPPDREIFVFWSPVLMERFCKPEFDDKVAESTSTFVRLPQTTIRAGRSDGGSVVR